MFKTVLIYILLLLSCTYLAAQPLSVNGDQTVIIGTVMDESTNKPLDYSSVSLYSEGAAELINGSITGEDGKFKFQVAPGNYVLKIQFISYTTKVINLNIRPGEGSRKLGNISLSLDSKQLEEVVVTSEKDQFEFSLDKRTFNVNENVSNLGRNASEILDNIPSVTVDIEGNVSLRGNDNVNIMIDGKPSGMAGISSQDALQALQGNMIEKIEVITNPSARYDAEGTAGIINIVLKKDAKQGINGSFGLNVGHPTLFSPNANVNYRSGKFNFFASAALRSSRYQGYGTSFSTYYDEDSTFSTDRDRRHDRGGLSQNFRLGADYYFNDLNKLTIAGIFNNANDENNTRLLFHDIVDERVIRTTERIDHEKEMENLTEISFNYEKTFDQKDRSLVFYGQYRDNSEIEASNIEQTSISEDPLNQTVRNDEGENTKLLQLDYIHPLSENSKFEAGLRTSFRDIKNNYVINQLDGDQWNTLPRFTNNFNYLENIYAGYLIYGNKLAQFSYQLGIRVEATDIKTILESADLDSTSSKSYVNSFPSLHLTYEMGKDQNVQLSYSRRLRRPGFRHLNPISSYSDNRNFRVGNPDLDPELTDAYEMGYLKNWAKSSFYGGVYYNHTESEIERLSFASTFENEEGVIYSRLYNLATEDAYGFEFNISKDFTEWWSMTGNFNFYRRITSGEAEGESFDADAQSYSGRLNTKINLPKDFDFQTNINYRGPRNTTQGRRLGFYTVDLGITRDFLDNNGTVTASVQDLFNSRKFRNRQKTDEFESVSEFQWRARQFTISLTYRLNQKKNRRGGDRDGRNGGDDGDEF